MAEIPSILLVFANPKDDLVSVKEEMKAIVDILRPAKTRKIIDYDSPFEDEPFNKIIKSTSGYPGYTASVFHFSGHANGQQILLTEDASSVNAVCDLLALAKTKLLFLNGCSTKGFLEKVFKDTGVIAAIATYNKVRDKIAAELSIMFYQQLMLGNDLDTIFRNMRSSFEKKAKILNWDGCYMRDLDLPTSSFPDENLEAFQWGLFYKERNYGKITISNLLEKSTATRIELNQLIATRKDELKKETETLEKMKTQKLDESFPDIYAAQEKKVAGLNSSITDLQKDLLNLVMEQLGQEDFARKKKISNDFSKAIKEIDYIDQREIYKEGKDCRFACYAATGDEDTLINLLLLRVEEEYGFEDNNHKSITIDYTSTGSQAFWPAMADELHVDKQETPEKIAGVLINDLFLGNRLFSQQHIFLKIYIAQLPVDKISGLVCDFWTNVKKVCDQSEAFTNKDNIRHKIVVILIDEMGSPERVKALDDTTETINKGLETKFKPMPWVKPLNPDKIESWIDTHTLDRVGIERTMANAIYTESNNGKIRKVLESVHKRCNMQDLDLFYKLNILPDDAQSLLGQIRK